MARVDNNALTEGMKGAFGKHMVYKKINGKTYMSKYPDRSQVQYNENQKESQKLFTQAVEYAKSVMLDPVRVAAYQKKIHSNKSIRGTSVYHAAIKAFLNKYSKKKFTFKVEQILKKYLNIYKVTDRQEQAIKHLISQGKVTNGVYQHLNEVSKATAARDLKDLQNLGIITVQSKGSGTYYSLVPLDDEGEMDDFEDEIKLI